MERRRYALRLMYDGASFRGWQKQPGALTVQGCVEEALRGLGLSAHLDVAARTDAGVHAIAQVITFSARAALDPATLRAEVNRRTPPALLCTDAASVSAGLHARASARARTYVYLVGWPAPEVAAGRAWSLPDPRAFPELTAPAVDLERLRAALAPAVGRHDFAAFARPGDQTARARARGGEGTVRELLRVEVVPCAWSPLAAVVLTGRGFLRAMVRHLVGAAVTAAVGATGPQIVAEHLARPLERYRGVRAPGWGLTLAGVDYGFDLFTPPGPGGGGPQGPRTS